MTEQLACAAQDLEDKPSLRVVLPTLDGTRRIVAIVRDDDGVIHAIGDTCTHDNVSLSEGVVTDGEIECWAHGSRFSLTTGEPHALPALTPVPVYPVRIDGEGVLVDVDAPLSPTKEHA